MLRFERICFQTLGPRVGGGSLEVLNEMIASGFRGRKSGKGYFVYDSSKMLGFFGKKKSINDGALRVLEKYRLTPPSSVLVLANGKHPEVEWRFVHSFSHNVNLVVVQLIDNSAFFVAM